MNIPALATTFLLSALLAVPAWASTPRDTLHTIAFDAMNTERDAGRLQSYASDRLDWMAQGGQLMTLRNDLNHLGRNLHQLQTEAALPTGEQRLLRRVARRVNLIAVDTQDALLFGRSHRGDLFNPIYQHEISRIYSNSEHLNHEARAALNFANTEGRF